MVGAERAEVGRDGARVVEMESMALGALAEARPFSVVRVAVDTPSRELGHIVHTAVGGLGAMRALRLRRPTTIEELDEDDLEPGRAIVDVTPPEASRALHLPVSGWDDISLTGSVLSHAKLE